MIDPRIRSAAASLWIDIALVAAIVACSVALYPLLKMQMGS